MKLLKFWLIGLCVLTFTSAMAKDKPGVNADRMEVASLEYGVYGVRVKNLGTGERLISQGNVPITEADSIPAELGVRFGLRFKLTASSYKDGEAIVRLLYLTPGFVNPDTGKRQDKVELEWKVSQDSPHHDMAFEFSDPAEIAAGEWRFYVFADDVELIEKVFQVVPQ